MSRKSGRSPLALNYRAIESVVPFANNARQHPRAQIRKLQRSLQLYGWTNPLIIDDEGNLICGHGRLEAAKLNGETQVPVISLGQMSEADRRAYIIADNKLAETATWSKALLRSELSGLLELGYDIEMTGFEMFEVDGIINFDDAGEESNEDRVDLPEASRVPVCRLGDHWQIGKHALVIGDGRSQEVVGRLLAGERAHMVMIDPPYGNRIANNVSGNGKIKHGNFVMGSGEVSLPEFGKTLLRPAFQTITKHCEPGAIAFVFMDWRGAPHLLAAAEGVFHEVKNLIVWIKNPGLGAFYRSAHELCYVFKVSDGKHTSNIALGKRNRTNVWRYPSANVFRKGRMLDLSEHPTIKCRYMTRDAILDVSKRGDVVLDTFAGSGTTGVACEMIGRRARLVELDPTYGDVILRRLGEATSCEPLLDGVTPLAEVAAFRRGDGE
ncbi:site-specific DNA-methyltransferase [Sphingomonas piscis]|uniref:Methyltransferase n=1 Tax=Sphingomonas piscis TaxID=2714943 RepID=A0A6G7YQX6_9SPHN|nr:DNA methyltransferase [Sphingomonas piscis]QIK79134.1 site-specific DNA-methyltransferase [Sphingomonas piscis]